MSSIFRSDSKDTFVKKEIVLEHLNKLLNSVGRGRFVKKKTKDKHYKETWWFFL